MYSYLLCFTIIFLVTKETQTQEWNTENVTENLKNWLNNLENLKGETERSSSVINDVCYSQSDIVSQYHLKNGAIEPLEGGLTSLHQKAGKLILRQNQALEANNFDQGLAQGFGKLTFFSQHNHASNDSYLSGNFQNGCLNGLIRGYEYLPLDGIEDDASYDSPAINSVLYYKSGYPDGPIWKILYSPDGIIIGYLYVERPQLPSSPNAYFEFSQKDVIFLYPDLYNGIKGQFSPKGHLIAGRRGHVLGERFSTESHELKEIQFVLNDPESPFIKADLATKTHLNSNPLVRDPYEATMVEVKKSTIAKAGEGVFLETDVSANTIVSYFNGVRLARSDVFSFNPFKKGSVYLVEMSDENGNDMFLDIPAKFADWKNYKASSGHKVNHAKTPNAAYTECEHPIFGKILCLYVKEDLKQGTELFTQYEVAMDTDGMKTVLKAALEIGHRYTGKSRKEFAREVRPYLQMASNFAEKLNLNEYLLNF